MDGLPSKFPTDADALIALLKKQQRALEIQTKSLQRSEARAEKSEARVERFRKKLASKDGHIQILEERLRELLVKRFGKSSARFNADQLQLFNEAEEQAAVDAAADDASGDNESITVGEHKRQRKKKTHPLPAHLPRVDVEHSLEEDEKHCHCGKMLERIGEDVHEQLSIIPQQYYVVRHIRHKYACSCKDCIRTAAMPAQPLPACQVTAQMLAHVMVSKYLDGGVPRVRGSKGLEIVRNFTIDEGLAPRSRLAGAGFKPLQAAGVKSPGGERCSKRCGIDHIRWDRERRTQVNRYCRVKTYLGDVETGLGPLPRDEGRGEPAEYSTGIWHKDGVTLYQALVRNEGTCRLDAKGAAQSDSLRESQSTDAGHRGGDFRSRVEGSVMGLDRRGIVVQFRCGHNSRGDDVRS